MKWSTAETDSAGTPFRFMLACGLRPARARCGRVVSRVSTFIFVLVSDQAWPDKAGAVLLACVRARAP